MSETESLSEWEENGIKDPSSVSYLQLNNFYFRLPGGWAVRSKVAGEDRFREAGLDPQHSTQRESREFDGKPTRNRSEIRLNQSRHQFHQQIAETLKGQVDDFDEFCEKLLQWFDKDNSLSSKERTELMTEIFPIAFATYIELRKMGYKSIELVAD